MASRRSIAAITLVLIAGALLALRIALPEYAQYRINKTLDELEDYQGHLDDVDIALWRGAYTLEGLDIQKLRGNAKVPLFSAKSIDMSVDWEALLNGAVVADVTFETPQVNFIDSEKGEDQTGSGADWRDVVKQLAPITINSLKINNGTIRFRNFGSEPPVNLKLSSLELTVTNITNADRSKGAQQARIDGRGELLKDATFKIYGILDPLGDYDNFDINLKVLGFNLTQLNNLAQAYGNFDFESGHGDFIMELRADNGQLEGYAKPLLNNVNIVDWEEVEGLSGIWETIVGGVGWALRNHDANRLAAKVEISGNLNQDNVSPLQAFFSILRNAFVEVYQPKFSGGA